MIQETVRLPHSAIHSLDGRYHPFHPPIPPLRPKMCRKPYSFNSTFSVPSLGEKVLLLHATDMNHRPWLHKSRDNYGNSREMFGPIWAGPQQWFNQITSWAWLQLAFARHQYCEPWWVKFHCWRRKHWHLIHRLWLGRLACWLSCAHLVQKSQSQTYPPAEHFTMLRFLHYKNSYLLHLIVKYLNIIILMIPIVL